MEVRDSLSGAIEKVKDRFESEKVLEIMYRPEALFRVRAVTRCSSTIPGGCGLSYLCLK